MDSVGEGEGGKIVMVGRFKDNPFIEEAEVKKSYRTVLNSSKMKLGTCASAT